VGVGVGVGVEDVEEVGEDDKSLLADSEMSFVGEGAVIVNLGFFLCTRA
jgi:hypothetical protein